MRSIESTMAGRADPCASAKPVNSWTIKSDAIPISIGFDGFESRRNPTIRNHETPIRPAFIIVNRPVLHAGRDLLPDQQYNHSLVLDDLVVGPPAIGKHAKRSF
jgi:hypothetical protein